MGRINDYTIVIMDGSDPKIVTNVLEVVLGLNTTCEPMDIDHPTTMVITTKTTSACFDKMTNVLERLYPGLCVFNPPM